MTPRMLRRLGHSELKCKVIGDALLSVCEGLSSSLATLSRIVLREPPVEPWWALGAFLRHSALVV